MKIIKFFSRIYWNLLSSPEKYARHIGVKIGKNCLIETRYFSSEPYLIEIGDNVQVTQNVRIHTHGGSHVARRKHPEFDVFGKVKIENWAYIGANSQIMPGVTIGEGALIAAGSIVSKSVPANEVWGGIPAKFICTVDEYISKNIPYNTNTKSKSGEEKKRILLDLPENLFIKK